MSKQTKPTRKQSAKQARPARRTRKPHPTDGWFSIGERAKLVQS